MDPKDKETVREALIDARIVVGNTYLIDKALALLDKPPVPTAPEWVSVGERTPHHHEKVLAYSSFPDGAWYQNVVTYHGEHGFLNLQQSFVTHWMPLPPHPVNEPL